MLTLEGRPAEQLTHVFRLSLHNDTNLRPQSALALARSLANAGVADGLWVPSDVDAAELTGIRVHTERIVFPLGRGDDKRDMGGALEVYLPMAAGGILERVTPGIEWMYSLSRRVWFTTSLQVKAGDVKRLFETFDDREAARGRADQLTLVPEAEPDAAPATRVHLDTAAGPLRANRRPVEAARFRPSPVLARIVGEEPLPRFEIANRVWAYITEQRLMVADQPDRILADDMLRPVFGGRSEIAKRELPALLGRHLTDV
jgi:hypothetical protein